jgi:hypothetical protein
MGLANTTESGPSGRMLLIKEQQDFAYTRRLIPLFGLRLCWCSQGITALLFRRNRRVFNTILAVPHISQQEDYVERFPK